jgi:hypothetical protein
MDQSSNCFLDVGFKPTLTQELTCTNNGYRHTEQSSRAGYLASGLHDSCVHNVALDLLV